MVADFTHVNNLPKWVRETVFYQIFPERFCNGNKANDVKTGEYIFDMLNHLF